MWRGYEYARDLNTEKWEFAVGDDTLSQAGLSPIDVQWLVSRGFVESRAAGARPSKNRDQTSAGRWFVLTEKGYAFVRDHVLAPDGQSETPAADSIDALTVREPGRAATKPSWNWERRELRIDAMLVKRFRWPAANQEAVLMAFEEDGWPARIDDPLSPQPEQDTKRRLHDTIKCLNRNHHQRLIHFHGDGTGEGVLWMFLEGN